jgi:hypothetical protein
MAKNEADKKPDIKAAPDRGERTALMEPLVLSEGSRHCAELTDLDRLEPKSGTILEAVLYRGELPRGAAAGIIGTGDRQARRVVSALIERGVLLSDSSRAPLRLAFPATLASRWMPGLFPDRAG